MEITKKYVATILSGVPKQNLVDYFYEVFKQENGNYNYSLRSVDLLINGGFKNINDFDINEIIPHLNACIYDYNSDNVTDVKIDYVNNIEQCIIVSFIRNGSNYRYTFNVSFDNYNHYVEENKATHIATSVDVIKSAE